MSKIHLQSETKARVRVSLISIVLGGLILGLKFLAYILTDSTALKSDALEGVVNVVAAVFAFGAVIFAERPADKTHPYGHGKIEYFSAAFEGGLISLAAILIFYEGVRTLIEGSHVKDLNLGLMLNVGAGALNGILGLGLIRAGRRLKSKAIEADGHHVLSDFYTTIALVFGLLIVKFTGWTWMDPVLALGIGLLLAITGFRLVKQSSNALLDQEDPEMIDKLVATMNRKCSKEIIGVHALRTLRTGRFTHIDIHVAVPEFEEIRKVHDVVDLFGKEVLEELGVEGEFHAHLDPCRRLYCEHCAVEPCPIRRAPFVSRSDLSIEKAVSLDPV